jgi:transposase
MMAALTRPWSTGQGEGQICRVQLMKRFGDGRAKLDLLQPRIFHRMTVAAKPGKQRSEVTQPAAA